MTYDDAWLIRACLLAAYPQTPGPAANLPAFEKALIKSIDECLLILRREANVKGDDPIGYRQRILRVTEGNF